MKFIALSTSTKALEASIRQMPAHENTLTVNEVNIFTHGDRYEAKPWILATLEHHAKNNAPDFGHQDFVQVYEITSSPENECAYGAGWIKFTVSSGGHATAHGFLDAASMDDATIVYGYSGSRGKQTEHRDNLFHAPLSELFADDADWAHYESAGPMAYKVLSPGGTVYTTTDKPSQGQYYAIKTPSSMLPWETQYEHIIRTKGENQSEYSEFIHNLLWKLAAQSSTEGIECPKWSAHNNAYSIPNYSILTVSENVILQDYLTSNSEYMTEFEMFLNSLKTTAYFINLLP